MTIASKYLIIGGGMTTAAAVNGIRRVDSTGSITVLSGEKHLPYNRPPLSKKLWTGKPLDSIWREIEASNADFRLNTQAVTGDPTAQTITDNHGVVYHYEKLLLATGGAPRHLPFDDKGVIYFRTLDDYQRVRELADRKASFAIIGGGFVGSEIASALAMNDCEVTMIFPEASIGDHFYPAALSRFLSGYFQDKGMQLLAGQTVSSINTSGKGITIQTSGGKTLSPDAVLAGIGIQPSIELAKSLGLKVDNGILVNEDLTTSHPNIYAAGDVANYYSTALDTRRRVEHEDNANTMGAAAGRSMAGLAEKYDYLPYFYSDLFDLGYEAVGEFSSKMDIFEDWQDPFQKGVVYYLIDNRVRGVLLWNTWGQVNAARKLISGQQKFSHAELKDRISD